MSLLSASAVFLAEQSAPAAGQPEAPNPLVSLLPMALFGLGFYFLLIRPQQKKARETAQKQASLKTGDKVSTSGGIIGKVVTVEDAQVTLEVASGVRIPFRRDHIVEFFADDSAKA